MRVKPVTPAPPLDLSAWQIDLACNLLVHANGLRMQFVRPDAGGDWRRRHYRAALPSRA